MTRQKTFLFVILLVAFYQLSGCTQDKHMIDAESNIEDHVKTMLAEFLEANSQDSLIQQYGFHLDRDFLNNNIRNEGKYWVLGPWTIEHASDEEYVASQALAMNGRTIVLRVRGKTSGEVLPVSDWSLEELDVVE